MNTTPEVFEDVRTVTESEIDELGHVNNVIYLQWVQDMAEKHWKTRATEADQESSVWVVLSHYIEYKKPAFRGDRITLKTFVGETQGVRSVRYVEIYRDQDLLAKARTEWCLLDAGTNRPKRVTNELLNFFMIREK